MARAAQFRWLYRLFCLGIAFAAAGRSSFLLAGEHHQAEIKPDTVVDIKALGAAADLFTANSAGDKYQKRGVISVMWLGPDRIAVAFSTNPRYGKNETPEPLHVRLIVFDRSGKQQYARDWQSGDQGPAGDANLDIEPGPDESILAIHQAADPGAAIPEGNFIQVLKPDTSLLQNFYVPSTSAYIASWPSTSALVLEQFYADNHRSITWYRGHPLASAAKLDLPRNQSPALVGHDQAAHVACSSKYVCSGVQVLTADHVQWMYKTPSPELVPVPWAFLNPSSLLVELRHKDRAGKLTIEHQGGTETQLPDLPGGLEILSVSGISADGQRFAIDIAGESKLCGAFDFLCKERGRSVVIDTAAKQIVFDQPLSGNGGQSALSPDGHHIAIFDKNKLMLYSIP